MSCYQVSQRHLATLVGIGQALAREGRFMNLGAVDPDNSEAIYQILARVNVDSVNAYYGESDPPAPLPEGGLVVPRVALRTLADIAAATKALDSYMYQSMNAESWLGSDVYYWCNHARRSLVDLIPGFLAAYSEADWNL